MTSQHPATVSDALRSGRERLERGPKMVYLDYAGAGLPSEEQMKEVHQCWSEGPLLGNPHSGHSAGQASARVVEQARRQVLSFFGASRDYHVIFTAGCTSSLRLASTSFPWSGAQSVIAVHSRCHNSAVGMREVATAAGASYFSEFRRPEDLEAAFSSQGNHMCVFPAECNATGEVFDLAELTKAAKKTKGSNVCVVVDGAAAAGRTPVSLDDTDVDMFSCSFYKIFGHPTGLGALLVKKSTCEKHLSQKVYFGGGTVEYVVPEEAGLHKFRSNVALKFEDGTPNFGAISALSAGFRALDRLGGVATINTRVTDLRRALKLRLSALHHSGSGPLIRLYEDPSATYGATLAFSILDSSGAPVGHALVDQLASASGILLRTGCFCNPGTCRDLLDLGKEQVLENAKAGHVCWDDRDLVHGKATGCVRVSLGAYSTMEDVGALIEFLTTTFLSCQHQGPQSTLASQTSLSATEEEEESRVLRSIVVYPIKGVHGVEVEQWFADSRGLLYDREWMVVSKISGNPVIPKSNIHIASSLSITHFGPDFLTLASPHCTQELKIGCHQGGGAQEGHFPIYSPQRAEGNENTVSIRGTAREGFHYYSPQVDCWLTSALQEEVHLIRKEARTNFRNTGEFLVVDYESYQHVLDNIPEGKGKQLDLVDAFRPNFVTQRMGPSQLKRLADLGPLRIFPEQGWQRIKLEALRSSSTTLPSSSSPTLQLDLVFSSPCYRCMQVGVKAKEAKITAEPLATVSRVCRSSNENEKPVFGAIFSPVLTPVETPQTSTANKDGPKKRSPSSSGPSPWWLPLGRSRIIRLLLRLLRFLASWVSGGAASIATSHKLEVGSLPISPSFLPAVPLARIRVGMRLQVETAKQDSNL